MAKFCFYNGDDVNVVNRLRLAAVFCWGEVEEAVLDSFRLFIAAEDHRLFHCRTATVIGAISGYAQTDIGLNYQSCTAEFFSEFSDNKWPLGNEWTGSFAAAAYSSAKEEITLCNDVIGHFPLYYAHVGKGFIGGTSLIALAAASAPKRTRSAYCSELPCHFAITGGALCSRTFSGFCRVSA